MRQIYQRPGIFAAGVIASAYLVAFVGCAPLPENVAPIYVSEQPYLSYSYDQLVQEQSKLAEALKTEAGNQRNAHNDDTLSVLLVGVPMGSSSGGNRESEIATLKGELQAVQQAAKLNHYTLPPIPDPTARPPEAPRAVVNNHR